MTDTTGFVYAIRFGDYIKIGFSNNPPRRLVAIRSGFGCAHYPKGVDLFDVEPLFAVPGTPLTERAFQSALKAHHEGGEWFHVVPALLDLGPALKWPWLCEWPVKKRPKPVVARVVIPYVPGEPVEF